MASLNSIYLSKEKLKTVLATLEAKGINGIEITVSIDDERNQYGKNVSAYVSQSQEDRAAKKDRFFIGGGNTFWTDGVINQCRYEKPVAPASGHNPNVTTPPATPQGVDDDSLPF